MIQVLQIRTFYRPHYQKEAGGRGQHTHSRAKRRNNVSRETFLLLWVFKKFEWADRSVKKNEGEGVGRRVVKSENLFG